MINELKRSLAENGAPYLISLISSDGRVQRRICSSERGVKDFLIESGIFSSNSEEPGELLRSSERVISTKTTVDIELIIEQIIPAIKVIIFGAGHVGKAVVQISAQMGWDVIIIDDRLEFLNRIEEIQSSIQKVNRPFDDALKDIRVGKTSALVIVTRGHQFDETCLEEGLKTEAFYIGMIGSRRRVASILKRLQEKGISRERLLSINAPIGIDIGARTPQEIAISIVAEIIKIKNSLG